MPDTQRTSRAAVERRIEFARRPHVRMPENHPTMRLYHDYLAALDVLEVVLPYLREEYADAGEKAALDRVRAFLASTEGEFHPVDPGSPAYHDDGENEGVIMTWHPAMKT